MQYADVQGRIVELDEIYQPPDSKDRMGVETLLDTIGPKPLSSYLQQDSSNCWERYAQSAFQAISDSINKYKAKKVLIVGHGNIINSIGLLTNPEALELNDIYFHHCEGFEVSCEGAISFIKN